MTSGCNAMASVSSQNQHAGTTQQDSNKAAASSGSSPTRDERSCSSQEKEDPSKPLPSETEHEGEKQKGEEEGGCRSEEGEATPTTATPLGWLEGAGLLGADGGSVRYDRLEKAEIFALYFCAAWCPPCRKFVPKLTKLYHHLQQQKKPFEVICVSSDKSKEEMLKYMRESKMEWPAVDFTSPLREKLRETHSVESIPKLVVVNKEGTKLVESARRSVEGASSSSLSIKLFKKWMDANHSHLKHVLSPETSGTNDGEKVAEEVATDGEKKMAEEAKATKSSETGLRKRAISKPLVELAEKDDKIQQLETLNIALRQRQTDLVEENAELKRQLAEAKEKLTALEKSSKEMENDQRGMLANLNTRGWLFKRGVKGPTASVWRRRYFRCDQGSKIYYYKSATEGSPQGYIDLDQVVSVQAVSPAQQDKNNATFLVQCGERTYQLQAHDEATMRKWMGAIEYLREWRTRNTRKLSRSSPPL